MCPSTRMTTWICWPESTSPELAPAAVAVYTSCWMARLAMSSSRLLLKASAETSTVITFLPEIEVASFFGFCHGVKKSGSRGLSDIMARSALVTGFSCSGTSRNSR
ncbi:hypothetical protein D9M72_590550 [compost metagenome]